MKDQLELAFEKIRNPRMSAGLLLLHSLLAPLKGPVISPTKVRETVNRPIKERKLSKQSVTNAARRLEEAELIEREQGYSVNHGYIISMLLNSVIALSEKVDDLEEEIDNLKGVLSGPS
ncbi:MAG: MarR family transcriptional regulator [Candidatus Thorarchaeota archaeon]|nr:MarR family transcriptional regulator [Candidatus Thorarchaeota archaeon]